MCSDELPRLIRDLRVGAGISQRALARRASTSQAWVSRVEAGQVAPSFEAARRLLLALGYELAPIARRLEGHDHDELHRAQWRRLDASERLERALAWGRLAEGLESAARR